MRILTSDPSLCNSTHHSLYCTHHSLYCTHLTIIHTPLTILHTPHYTEDYSLYCTHYTGSVHTTHYTAHTSLNCRLLTILHTPLTTCTHHLLNCRLLLFVLQGSVLGPLPFIYNSEMFEPIENRLFAYADDSTLYYQLFASQQTDVPAVPASLNSYLSRIQEWCNYWCMTLNPNKTKALVVSRFKTVSPPHSGLILSGVSIRASPNLDILGVKFDSPSKTMCVVLFPVSLRELVFWGWWNIYLWTPLCYFVAILHLFSQSWSIVLRCGGHAAECLLQLLELQVYSVARLYPNQRILSLCHLRRVAELRLLYRFNSYSNHCLFNELPSASTRVRYTRAAAAAHPSEFEVSRCRTSQFSRSFLAAQVQLRNDVPYTVVDTRTLDGFKSAVNRWLLPLVVFSPIFRGAGACGAIEKIYKQLCFSYLGLCCWFS